MSFHLLVRSSLARIFMKNAPAGLKPSGGRTLRVRLAPLTGGAEPARFQRARLNDWIDFNGNRARWKRAPTGVGFDAGYCMAVTVMQYPG